MNYLARLRSLSRSTLVKVLDHDNQVTDANLRFYLTYLFLQGLELPAGTHVVIDEGYRDNGFMARWNELAADAGPDLMDEWADKAHRGKLFRYKRLHELSVYYSVESTPFTEHLGAKMSGFQFRTRKSRLSSLDAVRAYIRNLKVGRASDIPIHFRIWRHENQTRVGEPITLTLRAEGGKIVAPWST